MIIELFFGFITGIFVGYLFMPMVIISGRSADLVWSQTEKKINCDLLFVRGLTTMVMFIFLLALLIEVEDSVLRLLSSGDIEKRGEVGRFAALGIFVGVLIYAIVPSIERKVRSRGKMRNHKIK